MGNTYTTEDLLDDIELFAHIPLGEQSFSKTQLLRLATLQMQNVLVAQILSSRGGYYLTYQDYDVNSSGLYMIPGDSVAGSLANVELIQEPTIVPVNPIEENEQFSTISPTSTSYGFFMRGNYVQILPTPNIGVPRLWFFKRTSNLVLPLACAQVTSINDTFDIVEVSTLPDTFAIGTEIDACAYRPPFNITGETTISDITGTSILLTDPLPDLSIGDYLALDGQTPVPQIPVEYTQVLAQMVVCQVYEIQGYKDKLAAAEKSLEKYQKALLGMISPRVKNKTKIIMPVNGGFLAGNQNRMANFPAGR